MDGAQCVDEVQMSKKIVISARKDYSGVDGISTEDGVRSEDYPQVPERVMLYLHVIQAVND